MKRIPLFLLCLFTLTTIAQSPDQFTKIDQLFSAWNNATPGGSIAIQQGDKIIYHKAFGLADLEHNVPNTTETIFESGSVAKQFTAMSILLLAAEGKLALTDDIRKYVPEIPKYSTTITIQMLLNHTSGLKDWGSVGALTGWPRTTRAYTQDLALQIMSNQKSTNYAPGTEYSYSNSNYSLLVTIVERMSGQSLSAFTEEKLFKPLGMTHTQWRDNFREIVPNRAVAYRKQKGVYEQLMPFEDIHGHGGLLTTTADLLKWNSLLETYAIGGKQVYQWRVQKGKLSNGKEISYAAGLFVDSVFGYDEISHSGATAGYRAWLAYYPSLKLSVVALSNDGSFNPTRMGEQIVDLFMPTTPDEPMNLEPMAMNEPATEFVASLPSPEESDLKKFEGLWRSVRHMDVQKIERKNQTLINNQVTATIISRDTLFFDRKWIRTQPNRMLTIRRGDTLSYVKVSAPDLSPTSLTDLTGTYQSEEANATYRVDLRNSEVWITNNGLISVKLRPSFKDGFFSNDGDLYEFKRNKKGKVVKLLVSTARATQVPFTKVR
jgi:CubicO group peptidase (beta-lactamase class C family)